jgi:hypothetical protein
LGWAFTGKTWEVLSTKVDDLRKKSNSRIVFESRLSRFFEALRGTIRREKQNQEL